MKIHIILILAIIVGLSLQAFLSDKGKDNKPKGKIPKGKGKTPKGKGKSGGASGTNVLAGKTNSTNAVGLIGPAHFSISSRPYKVKRCDQILLIPAKQIIKNKDYCKKKDIFLTMSAYMINSFSKKDPTKLEKSIQMNKSIKIPSIIPGAPGCVDFESERTSISLCLSDDAAAKEIIKAYMAFLKCRRGESLSSQNIRIKTLNMTCPDATVNMTYDVNPYYKNLRVPGS